MSTCLEFNIKVSSLFPYQITSFIVKEKNDKQTPSLLINLNELFSKRKKKQEENTKFIYYLKESYIDPNY